MTAKEQLARLESELRIAKASGAPQDYVCMIREELCRLYLLEGVQ